MAASIATLIADSSDRDAEGHRPRGTSIAVVRASDRSDDRGDGRIQPTTHAAGDHLLPAADLNFNPDTQSAPETDDRRRLPPAGRAAVGFALGVGAGIIAARLTQSTVVWPWLLIAGCSLSLSAVVRFGMLLPAMWDQRLMRPWERRWWDSAVRSSPAGHDGDEPATGYAEFLSRILLVIVVIALAAGWSVCRTQRMAGLDVTSIVDPDAPPQVVRLEGRVRTPPKVREFSDGPMANPWSSRPRTYFQVAVLRALPGPAAAEVDGATPFRLTGRVLVRINDEERRLRIGDRISLTGVLSAFPPASNPGEADRADIARRQGLAGLVAVPAREAVVLHESSRWADLRSAFARWRSRLNDAAGGWLIHSVPNSEDERRHALLEAMMLGERGPALDSIDRSFRRVGLSHVLAISGLHLVVLTITVIMLVRAFTGGGGLSIGWPFSRHRSSGLRGCDLSVRQGRANADDASSSDSLIEADAALAWWGRRDRRGRRGSGGRSGGGGGGGGGSAVRMTELIIVILVVGVYLLMLPARVPVWRAGLTVIIFAAAGLGGRQAKGASLLALAAAGLLLYNPDDLFEPGFQLSFGIVAAFITLGHAVDLRLRGIMYALNIVIPISSVTVARHADVQPGSAEDAALLSAEEPRTIADFLTLAFWQSLVTSLIAWAVSLPIIAFHFGAVCPIAPIAAVLAMPIVLVLLATGYVKAVATVLFPSVSVLFGPVLALWADMLIGLVDRLETVPLAAVAVPPPGLGWTILATVMIVWLCRQRLPAQPILRLSRRMAVAMCLLWLLVPRGLDMTGLSPIAGRVTMLSVGAGTCTVVEAGGTVFLMDAGSASVSVIGERIIVPALQRRGINRVDSIIISHADADHYNGVLDIVNALRVRRVIITSAIADKMHDAPEAVPNLIALWDHLDKMNITMEVVSAGDTRRIGKAELHWLHPCTSASFEHDNELSALVRIDIAGRRLLLTGDLVDAGLERVLAQVSNEALRADVMELPHHGARPDYLVQMLVERVQPSITLQSASHSRFTDGVQFMQHTTFTSRGVFVNSFGLPVAFGPVHPIVPPQHYATPEGGAITLLIPREDGAITASTFRPRPPKAPSSPSPTPASPSSPSPVVAAGSGQ